MKDTNTGTTQPDGAEPRGPIPFPTSKPYNPLTNPIVRALLDRTMELHALNSARDHVREILRTHPELDYSYVDSDSQRSIKIETIAENVKYREDASHAAIGRCYRLSLLDLDTIKANNAARAATAPGTAAPSESPASGGAA